MYRLILVLALGVGATMQQYGQNMGILLQNLEPMNQHPSAEQKAKVLEALRVLKTESHAIQPSIVPYAADPVMKYLSVDLSKQFSKIEEAYANGSYAVSHSILRETTQYCVGCHASSPSKHSATPAFKDPDFSGRTVIKAEFLTATRRHEEAMIAYEKVLSDKNFRAAEPELWERSAMNLMALTIRLRNDASVTLELISALLDQGSYQPQQLDLLRAWRVSAKSWSIEPLKPVASMLDKAQTLYASGKEQSDKNKNFGLIDLLRAATLLNSLALSDASDAQKAEGFRLMAAINEQLRDIYVWMRPEAYYEACVRLQPHTALARQCVEHLPARPELTQLAR